MQHEAKLYSTWIKVGSIAGVTVPCVLTESPSDWNIYSESCRQRPTVTMLLSGIDHDPAGKLDSQGLRPPLCFDQHVHLIWSPIPEIQPDAAILHLCDRRRDRAGG